MGCLLQYAVFYTLLFGLISSVVGLCLILLAHV
jgi:hypothetical protein